MNSSRDRFLDLMKNDILKLDLADLDFGIYRILNYRREEIEAFFDEELPAVLDEAMSGDDDGSEFVQSEEDHLYNALYTFFSRYYRDGDFQPQQRRAHDARYSVPYNGEDVHFHWRSKGSHYIKTTEELKSYSFRSGGWKVRFELVEAFQEPDNVKGTSRYFIPMPDECRVDVGDEGNLFIVPFAFRKLTGDEDKRYGRKSKTIDGDSMQERLINDLIDDIEMPSGVTKSDVLRHMQRYARKNRTDYFVHPHLGEFLRGELDYYLKNEFLDIEALTSPEAIANRLEKMRAVRDVASRIIDMLDEIESFQARLFEKRKFVLSNSYLIPIRLVPEELWDDVLANESQIERWRRDFGLTGRVGRKTLTTYPALVVDTSLLDRESQTRIVSSIADIGSMTDGVLVKGENFGALRTIKRSFAGTKLVYIDPPYNTGSDGFLYHDDFSRHSTWLSFMHERLLIARELMSDDGVLAVHIDEHESDRLRNLGGLVFGEENELGQIVWDKRNPKGDASGVAVQHEFILMWARSRQVFRDSGLRLHRRKANASAILERAREIFAEVDSGGRSLQSANKELRTWMSRQDFSGGEKAYNQLDADGRVFRPVSMAWPNRKKAPDEYFQPLKHPDTGEFCSVPARGWRNPPGTMDRLLKAGAILFGDDHSTIPNRKYFLDEHMTENLPSVIYFGGSDDEVMEAMALAYDDPSLKPTAVLSQIIEAASSPDSWVVDFFAGSGSTAHAVVKSNDDTGSHRKFLMIEMGDHFDGVLLPRVSKLMYASEWRGGEPGIPRSISSREGVVRWVPGLIQVTRLEGYEDSLNSLVADNDTQLGSKHRVRYVIPDSVDGSPVLLATERLEEPFAYQLEVHTDEGVRYEDVDLITTFNLIKGIRMRRYRELTDDGRRYVVVDGADSGKTVLVLWRSVADLDPEAEVSFLNEAIPEALGSELGDYDVIWHNADSVIPNSMSLDAEFKRLMFEPEPALS